MTQKKPAKPAPPVASTEQLIRHYNSQVDAYNKAIGKMPEAKRPEDGEMTLISEDNPLGCFTREAIINEIRRQNLRLGRHIKARSYELLLHHTVDAEGKKILKDGKYTVGYPYSRILEILAEEFPESSTSAACLRWYVTHMRSDADDQGLDWPDLPQTRPRSPAKKKG